MILTATNTNSLPLYNTINAIYHTTLSIYATGACQAVLTGHEGEISKVTFNPQGSRVLTASSDKTGTHTHPLPFSHYYTYTLLHIHTRVMTDLNLT